MPRLRVVFGMPRAKLYNCLAIHVSYLILITINLLCSTYIHSYSVCCMVS